MKYMGSKSRIKKYIVPILQDIINNNKIDTFVDLFCGGCNIIDSVCCKNRIANDISTPLISLFIALQDGISLLSEVSKELYDDVRANKSTSKYPQYLLGNVGFLASYNGRYFDGGYAKETVQKNGTVRNYYQESKRNILKQIPMLKDVKFFNKDYREIDIPKNALIYADIPYENTKQYSTSKNFNHSEFWQWAREMSKSNIVIISELNAPDDFVEIWSQSVLRSINAKNKEQTIEKLFIHKTLYDNIGKVIDDDKVE